MLDKTSTGIYCNVTARIPAELKLEAMKHGINLTQACREGIRFAVAQEKILIND